MKKILLVDDDPGIRDAFGLILDEKEYELMVYPDGNTILENEFPLPDLFIVDKQLGTIDGATICRFLKHNEQTKSIPIILTTAAMNIEQHAKEAEADAALEKPFSISRVRELLAHLLS